ncbi:MAG: hypothetical protein AAF404_19095 [Pseudomonadota bacterium]
MFTFIGLALGAFLGYLATSFFSGLQPMQDTGRDMVRKGTDAVGGLISNLTKSTGYGPMINIAIVVLLVLLLLWLISFSTALVIGFIGGVIYADDVGKLPFVSGVAQTIKGKLSGGGDKTGV